MKARHQFHSMEYVSRWAREVGNPVRESVFHHILAHLELLGSGAPHIVELASGPGLLAEFLLERLPDASLEGLDFSAPMLALARERTDRFSKRLQLHQVDLREDGWTATPRPAPQAIISIQALHDVGDEATHERIYRSARQLLTSGGLFLNADFMQAHDGGPSRIPVERHLAMLSAAGFKDIQTTLALGPYGCVTAVAP